MSTAWVAVDPPTQPRRQVNMQTHAKGTFETKAWSEQPYNQVEGTSNSSYNSVVSWAFPSKAKS